MKSKYIGYLIYDSYLKRVYYAFDKDSKDAFINDPLREKKNYTIKKIDRETDVIPDDIVRIINDGYLVNIDDRILTLHDESLFYDFPSNVDPLFRTFQILLRDLAKVNLTKEENKLIQDALQEYEDFIDDLKYDLIYGFVDLYEKFNKQEVLNRVIELSNYDKTTQMMLSESNELFNKNLFVLPRIYNSKGG